MVYNTYKVQTCTPAQYLPATRGPAWEARSPGLCTTVKYVDYKQCEQSRPYLNSLLIAREGEGATFEKRSLGKTGSYVTSLTMFVFLIRLG